MTEQRAFRALSLWRPWDQAILYGGKKLENRTWKPWDSIVGKLIAIHAGAKYDNEGARWMIDNHLYIPPSPADSPKGIVGVARVTGYVEESESPWFGGPKGWVLDEVQAFAKPIPCPGAQGLWVVRDKVLRELHRAIRGEQVITESQGRFDF